MSAGCSDAHQCGRQRCPAEQARLGAAAPRRHDEPRRRRADALQGGRRCECGRCGRTALHHACCFSSLDVVRQLCQHGAQPDLEDASGFRSWGARFTWSTLISPLCFIQRDRVHVLLSASS